METKVRRIHLTVCILLFIFTLAITTLLLLPYEIVGQQDIGTVTNRYFVWDSTSVSGVALRPFWATGPNGDIVLKARPKLVEGSVNNWKFVAEPQVLTGEYDFSYEYRFAPSLYIDAVKPATAGYTLGARIATYGIEVFLFLAIYFTSGDILAVRREKRAERMITHQLSGVCGGEED